MSIALDCDSIAKLRLKNIKFRYSRLQITCCDNDLSALYIARAFDLLLFGLLFLFFWNVAL